MTDYQTDDEKVEELKAWWKENGTSVIVGIALAVVALFGWEYWKEWKNNTAAEASSLYTQASNAAKTGIDKALPDIKKLQDSYSSTPYAAIASLKAAQQYAEQGQYEQAVSALRWVIDEQSDEGFRNLANVRLARVLLAMKKLDEALQVVNQPYPAAYQSLLEELKGDIYVAQNKPAEARAAYDKALATNASGSADFIRMKRDNLGQG